MARDSRYFAASGTDKVGAALFERLKREVQRPERTARAELYRAARRHYYPALGDEGLGSSSRLRADGEAGQLVRLRLAKARALAKARHAMVLGAPVNWKPQAVNADADARASTILAGNLLEFYWKAKGMQQVDATLLEVADTMSAAYAFPEWVPHAGEPKHVDRSRVDEKGRPLPPLVLGWQGDVETHVLLPWDVVLDGAARSYRECNWHFACLFKSRHDLAEGYGRGEQGEETALYESILQASEDKSLSALREAHGVDSDEDVVPVWYFFHRPTPAVPFGRHTIAVGPEAVLHDGNLFRLYEEVPLYRLAESETLGSPEAYSTLWDVFAAQEARDNLTSAVVSNNVAHARQTIAISEDAKVSEDRIGDLQTIYVKAGINPRDAVVPLQLTRSAPETFELINTLGAEMTETVGLNDVALGNPERGGSGAQMALLTSRALEQNAPLSQARVRNLQALGYGLLSVLRKHVSEERLVPITGKGSAHLYAEEKYTGERLNPVRRVLVDVGNPLEQTAAGRMELGDRYVKQGWVKSPEQLQQVYATGRLEPLTRATEDALLLIQAENETLAKGEPQPVHAFQDHPLHCRENISVLSNPVALADERVVAAVQEHIGLHYLEYYGVDMLTDPERQVRLRLLLGQVPPVVLQPPGMPMDPAMGGMPPPGSDPLAPPVDGQPDVMGMPTPAAPPDNPLTGQPFDAATGGGAVPLPQ